MKIRNINESVNNNRVATRTDAVENTLKSVTKEMGGSYTQFIENAQPMKVKWYHIDQTASYEGKGFKDTAGPYDGGIKYKVIRDYVVYGYQDEKSVEVEAGDVLDHHYKIQTMTLIHLPRTLTPYVGDRLSFSVENHRFLYRVTYSGPVNFHNKTFIRTDVVKCEIKPSDYYEDDFKRDGLLTEALEFIQGNVGTDFKPFMQKADIDNINKLTALKNELMEQFNDYFYDADKNIYTSLDADNRGYNTYVPLLVDLQMEFRPLWVYGINTILTHETIVNRRSKFNYKKNIMRKFLNRLDGAWEKLKNEGVEFSPYPYTNDIISPTFKIQSYLNDNTPYMVYDYYHGDNDFYEDGEWVTTIEDKKYLKIPEKYWELFDKYTKDEITIEWMINWLEEYDFDMILCSMLMAFIVLTITDKIIKKYNEVDSNRGILT